MTEQQKTERARVLLDAIRVALEIHHHGEARQFLSELALLLLTGQHP